MVTLMAYLTAYMHFTEHRLRTVDVTRTHAYLKVIDHFKTDSENFGNQMHAR